MARKDYMVTFEMPGDLPVEVSEFLRYGGAVSVQDTRGAHSTSFPYEVDREVRGWAGNAITMYCPRECHGPTWQNQNVARIRSFGRKVLAWSRSR